MSVLWQTGKPPEKTDLIIRMRCPGREEVCRYFADKCDGVWYVDGMEAKGIEVLAWSTLDAAPDVIGRLEEYAKKHFTQSVLIDYMVRQDTFEIGRYDPSEGEYHDTTSAPSLAAAIEQLCEKQ